jgi:iron complex outermembrane receptor protein
MKQIINLLFFAWALPLAAQNPLSLNIVDQAGSPLDGVTIRVRTNNNWEQLKHTDASGAVFFSFSGSDTFVNVSARHIGKYAIDTILITSSQPHVITMKDMGLFLEPLEVKALRVSERSPFAKLTLSKNQLEKSNLGQDIPFILNQTPSVTFSSDAGNGVGYTGIRIRGTDATRINVTLNGIPYNDAESQGTFLVNIPDIISSASSVQIQRGIGSSTNGAGAFGATINLSTNDYHEKAYMALNNSIGSFGTVKNTLMLGSGLLDNHFTADLRLSRITSNGYVDRARSDLYAWYASGAWINDKSSLRLNAFSGNEETYQAWYGISAATLDTNRTYNPAGMEKPGVPYDDQTDNYKQTHYQLFFNHRMSNSWALQLTGFLTRGKGYYNEYRGNQLLADYLLSDIINGADTIRESDLIRQLWLDNYFFGNVFSLQHTNTRYKLTFGGSWSRYNGSHFGKVTWVEKQQIGTTEYYRYPAHKDDGNLYTKFLYDWASGWSLFGDVQYRYVRHEMNGFRGNGDLKVDRQFHFLNPKIGVNYNKKQWRYYLSYAMAGKEPNRDDFESASSQQPAAEIMHDLESGIEIKNTNWSASINLYGMFYKDQLVQSGRINDVGAYTRINVPNSTRLGIEWQSTVRITNWAHADANFTLSRNKIAAFTEFIDEYDLLFNYIGQKQVSHSNTNIAFSPSMIGAASLHLRPIRDVECSLLNKYVGKQYLDNTQNEERVLNPFFINDLRVTVNLFSKKWQGSKLILQVNNITNKLYEPNGYVYPYYFAGTLLNDSYFYPMAGINYMLGLNINFSQ